MPFIGYRVPCGSARSMCLRYYQFLMQIRFSQLTNTLKKQSVAALLVSGDEPYQQMLAADQFRQQAKISGFTERKILSVESGFDWSELDAAINNLSLFGERTLVDLRIPSGKPGAKGSKAIIHFVQSLHADVMILIQVPRLDRSGINSAWVKAIDKAGCVMRVWPLNEMETKKWIRQKLTTYKFTVTDEVVNYITQHVEGNLLAAMQEIEKINLISDSKQLDAKNVSAALTNSSRYSLNELLDSLVKKDVERLLRILLRLKNEDFTTPLLLWGLSENIRKIYETKIHHNFKSSASHTYLNRINKLHQKEIGVENNDSVNVLLKHAAYVDRVIKGRASGNDWRELMQLSVATQLSS